MNTRITLFLFSFVIINQSFAQLQNGSFAPNFVATDINGIEYNLYDLLDEEKVVILDFYTRIFGINTVQMGQTRHTFFQLKVIFQPELIN